MIKLKKEFNDYILKMLDMGFYMNKLTGHVTKAKKLSEFWEMLIPHAVQVVLGTYEDGALTYFVSGRESEHHDTTDSKRYALKTELRAVNSKLYGEMNKHIVALLKRNALVRCYKKRTGSKSDTYSPVMLETYKKQNPIAVREEYQLLLEELGKQLTSLMPLLKKDRRISDELKKYLELNAVKKPETVLSVLVFLSLFAENDRDAEFYTDFEAHYLTGPEKKICHINNILSLLDQVAAGAEIPGDLVYEGGRTVLVIALEDADKLEIGEKE